MSSRYQQDDVSKAVWPWQNSGPGKEIAGPSLLYSLTALGVGLTAGTGFWYFGHEKMSYIVLAITGFVFLCSRFAPALYAIIEAGFAWLSHAVGLVLTWLLLVPFFYIFFTIGRCIQRISGRDPMARTMDIHARTYWQIKEKNSDPQRYQRQF